MLAQSPSQLLDFPETGILLNWEECPAVEPDRHVGNEFCINVKILENSSHEGARGIHQVLIEIYLKLRMVKVFKIARQQVVIKASANMIGRGIHRSSSTLDFVFYCLFERAVFKALR